MNQFENSVLNLNRSFMDTGYMFGRVLMWLFAYKLWVLNNILRVIKKAIEYRKISSGHLIYLSTTLWVICFIWLKIYWKCLYIRFCNTFELRNVNGLFYLCSSQTDKTKNSTFRLYTLEDLMILKCVTLYYITQAIRNNWHTCWLE